MLVLKPKVHQILIASIKSPYLQRAGDLSLRKGNTTPREGTPKIDLFSLM